MRFLLSRHPRRFQTTHQMANTESTATSLLVTYSKHSKRFLIYITIWFQVWVLSSLTQLLKRQSLIGRAIWILPVAPFFFLVAFWTRNYGLNVRVFWRPELYMLRDAFWIFVVVVSAFVALRRECIDIENMYDKLRERIIDAAVSFRGNQSVSSSTSSIHVIFRCLIFSFALAWHTPWSRAIHSFL